LRAAVFRKKEAALPALFGLDEKGTKDDAVRRGGPEPGKKMDAWGRVYRTR